jgi:hypothetical protein
VSRHAAIVAERRRASCITARCPRSERTTRTRLAGERAAGPGESPANRNLRILDCLALDFRGDIAGSDAAGDLAWNPTAQAGYRVPTTVVGHRVLAFDQTIDHAEQNL